MKYSKYKKEYRFKDLKDSNAVKEKYSDVLTYSRSYPHTFYLWFAYECDVVLFKRPKVIVDYNTLVSSVVIKTDTKKAAKVIARNLTEKELKRIFNKCNFVIL